MESFVPGLPVETPHQVLEEMNKILSSKEKWVVGTSAIKAGGTPCYPNDPQAERWCITGAMNRVIGPNPFEKDKLAGLYLETSRLLSKICSRIYGYESLTFFNDSHKYQDVKDLLEEALKKEEREV